MKKLYVFLTIAYVSILSFAMLRPGAAAGDGSGLKAVVDNCAHVPAYLILMVLLVKCFPKVSLRKGMICFVAVFLYGLLMEYLQSFVPNRYPSAIDAGSNGIGALIGWMLTFKKKTT